MVFFKKTEPEDNRPENDSELNELKMRVKEAGLAGSVEEILLKEVEKLFKTSPSSAEYTIGLNYVEYVLSLPWNKMSEDNLDIRHAGELLNLEHYGLTEIKDRILEHLAVRILKLSRQFNILVADDEKTTRNNLNHVLTREGYAVTTAENGRQAVDLLSNHCFDVIITDLKMDQIDGLGVLEASRAIDPSIQVIIITGYATVQTAVESLQKGSFHYLSKPFKLNEIRDTVKRALKKKKYQLKSKGPILCFAGPPGTGKTSLGHSIAKSLEKKFIRISLAGIKDEAEIRGHRRSYVGALPGRIIQEIRRVGSKNPVFMLDEVDKLGQDFKGDPAAALLEALDPEQNAGFIDHYIDIPFDLSQVMFITTANRIDLIPGPLLDRMEMIRLSGYTGEEKEVIDVMKESAQAALSYIRSNTERFKISENFFETIDIHIHVPAGAIPKDGPSAGLTIAVALVSLLTNRPARRDVALSGELTLSGRVLAIGGVREKILAARRAGVTTVIFPAKNKPELSTIPKEVKKGIIILTTDNIDDIIKTVLK